MAAKDSVGWDPFQDDELADTLEQEHQRMPRQRPPQTYAQKAKDAHVRCIDCGVVRVVTQRTANRIERGEQSGRCTDCRFGRHRPTADTRFGARLSLDGRPVDGTDYVKWWFDEYGFEAFEIAKAFLLGGGEYLIDVDMKEAAA
jgi:hypothetical protein